MITLRGGRLILPEGYIFFFKCKVYRFVGTSQSFEPAKVYTLYLFSLGAIYPDDESSCYLCIYGIMDSGLWSREILEGDNIF